MATSRRVGWWGKLPARGDFVGRGLPPRWRSDWDDWLQRGLVLASAELDGAALRARLAGFAPWRYLALPASGEIWCGILVPSHDRVGRAFPLTLAERCGAPAAPASPAECAARLARLQAAAAQGPEALESAIAALSAPHEQDGPHAQAWPAPPASLWWPLAAGDEAMPLRAAWPPQPALLLDLLGIQPAAHQIASAE